MPSRSIRCINEIGRARSSPTARTPTRASSIHLDDGRSFVRKTGRQYDLIVYALVDSLVLHSGYSSVCGWRASCSPSRRFATSRRGSSPAACSRCTTITARAGSSAGWRRWPRRCSATEPIVISLPTRTTIAPGDNQRGATSRSCSSGTAGSQAARGDPGAVRGGPVLLAQSAAARERADQRLRARAAGDRRASPGIAGRRSARPGRHDRDRPAADRRLAVPLPARADDPRAEPPGHGIDRGALAGDPASRSPRCGGPAQRPDVLPRRGLHAAGDQGRRAHGLALRHRPGSSTRSSSSRSW